MATPGLIGPRFRKRAAAFVLGTALGMIGCAERRDDTEADLIPTRMDGVGSALDVCDTSDNRSLQVTVTNVGDLAAEALVIVVFEPPEIRSSRLGRVPAGASAQTVIELPSRCFNPDCDFDVFVDPIDEVDETDERNNHVAGRCLGA